MSYNSALILKNNEGVITLNDFWWLTSEQANEYVYVELVYNQEFNEPNFTEIQNISKWCECYQKTNVYRSLSIWKDRIKNEAL
jgi:hypothetical protein